MSRSSGVGRAGSGSGPKGRGWVTGKGRMDSRDSYPDDHLSPDPLCFLGGSQGKESP